MVLLKLLAIAQGSIRSVSLRHSTPRMTDIGRRSHAEDAPCPDGPNDRGTPRKAASQVGDVGDERVVDRSIEESAPVTLHVGDVGHIPVTDRLVESAFRQTVSHVGEASNVGAVDRLVKVERPVRGCELP